MSVYDDFQILKKMLVSHCIVPLQKDFSSRYYAYLEETDPANQYRVGIMGLPERSIIIKADVFESPKSIFNGTQGETKRSDFILIIQEDEDKKWLVYIEMKSSKSSEKEIIQQLKGSECLVTYCRAIGQKFWDENDFLSGYQSRFIGITKINLSKSKTRHGLARQPLHDRPERLLKIFSQEQIHFKTLINGKQ